MENDKFTLQSIMSANTNQLPKRNKFIASSVIFSPNSEAPKPPNFPFHFASPVNTRREVPDNAFRQPFTQARNFAAQSMIFPSSNQNKPKMVGLSKLDSMARHIAPPAEEAPLVNSSISQNRFFKTTFPKKQPNPFASQIMTTRSLFNSDGPATFSEEVVRKRRESVGIETFNREGVLQQNLRFLQRVAPVLPEPIRMQKHVDCESTNSSSGAELLRPKNFNFLKKRKDQNDPNGSQSLKQFQQFKKTQHIWPLSISPMEQKAPLYVKDAHEQPASASKLEYRHHQPQTICVSNIEFKKKKMNENEIEPKKIVFRGTQVSQSSTISPSDFKQRDIDDAFLLKNRVARPQREISIRDFQLMNKLGKGAFGQVYMAQQKTLGFICVIKKMSKKRIKEAKVQEHIIRQIKLQSYLNNGHCTSLYGYFHDEEYLYLILEPLPDGSLQQVKKKRKLPEKEAVDIVRQVALGLKYMHEQSVIHRDLKPQNIFINEGYIKIGDFGCSIYHNEFGLRNTIVGCLQYSSPEQLFKQGYTDKIDSWSLGILTYEILFGKSPFESDIKKIVKNGDAMQELSEIVFPPAPVIKEETKSFIINLLANNPEQRMDMDQVLSHHFLKQQKSTK